AGRSAPLTVLYLQSPTRTLAPARPLPVAAPATAEAPTSTVAAATAAEPAAAVAIAGLAPSRRPPRQRGRPGVHVDLLLDRLALRGELLDGVLAAEVEPALAVDLGRLDHDLVADVDDLLHALHAVVGQARDVDQAVLVGQHLDECAERHDAHHL